MIKNSAMVKRIIRWQFGNNHDEWWSYVVSVDLPAYLWSQTKIWNLCFGITYETTVFTINLMMQAWIIKLLTHWGWVTHICISKLTIIGSDNSLLPDQHQAIIWNNAGILIIGPLGTNFRKILIEIHIFSSKKMHLKASSAKCLPFHLSLNVLHNLSFPRTIWLKHHKRTLFKKTPQLL